jgi:hypothetical protein
MLRAVALAPRAFRVRVWQITSLGQGPRTGRALPEGIDVGYPLTLNRNGNDLFAGKWLRAPAFLGGVLELGRLMAAPAGLRLG